MIPSQQRFGNYLISRRADGAPVELQRAQDELVFLAFDARINRLVELHILKAGGSMSSVEKRSALERATLAADVRGASFLRILEAGEQDDVVFYASNLTDGEFLEDYVIRRGALPATTAFCLIQQLLEDLSAAARKFARLTSHMKVSNPLVTTLEDAFLQLRIVDYGLSCKEPLDEEFSQRRVFVECCKLLFVMLTGQPYEGQNPDRFPVLTALPTNLRTNLRAALADPDQASPALERLRDDVREAYAAMVSSLQVRNSRKHIGLTDALQPVSQLQQVLLESVPVDELLKGRFTLAVGDEVRRYPFSIPAANSKTDQPVTVHLLPPSRIVDRNEMEAVPLQMWRFNAERHPNILRSLSLWENPEWTFLTEEREPGFPLSRLLAERGTLNPPEVLALIKQVRAGMDQAAECGVQVVDIHPSNLIFRIGKGGPMQAREFERLIAKRIDAWPAFTLKLRTHRTMRSLYEPLLAEPHEEAAQRDPHLAVRDYRCRSFVALATYLLTGERQVGATPAFSEAVPDTLATYLKECLAQQRTFGKAPLPGDFIAAFEQHMILPESTGQGFAAIMNSERVAAEELESVGSVSDFDNEWSESPGYLVGAGSQKLGVNPLPQPPAGPARGLLGMAVTALVALILAMLAWLFLFRGDSKPAIAGNESQAPVPPPAKVVAAPATSAINVSETPAEVAPPPTNPATKPVPPARPLTPEEVRKAIVPTSNEVEKLLRPKSEPSNNGLVKESR